MVFSILTILTTKAEPVVNIPALISVTGKGIVSHDASSLFTVLYYYFVLTVLTGDHAL